MEGFFGREAGQQRRKWLEGLLDEYVADPVNYLLGPTGIPSKTNAAMGLLEFTDAGDVSAATEASANLWNDPTFANAVDYATAGAAMALPMVSAKMMSEGVDVVGNAADELRRFAGDESGAIGPGSESKAQEIARLLREGRGNEVTDDMLAEFDANDEMELFKLYESGATGVGMPMDEASRMARADEMGFGDDVYHGTTHDFRGFGGGNTRNIEGHFGAGDYFTSSAKDASDNYAGLGPDLTQRINIRAERLADEMGLDYDAPEAREAAVAELIGAHNGAVIPARIRGDEVSVMPHTRGAPTTLENTQKYSADDFIDDAKAELGDAADDWEIRNRADEIAWEANADTEPEGTLADFMNSIRSQAWEYDFDADEAFDSIGDELLDGYISADALDSGMRAGLLYAEHPETGELAGNEIIRQAFLDSGFPNIRMSANSQGWNMPIPEGTDHVISSVPANIRSRFARFDPRLKHLRNLSAGIAGVGILNAQDEEELKDYLGLL